MKLLQCSLCGDVFSLRMSARSCQCGRSGGNYRDDGITVDVYTTKRNAAMVLGFANSTLISAEEDQKAFGDLPRTMRYAGRMVSPGREFKAFVIPESAPSVVWHYDEHICTE